MKLMILDGNSMVNRAFYGIRMLNAPDGTPTNGVYGFLSILTKLMTEESPDAVCVAFDLPTPTFRHEMYDGYKAKRRAMPDDLSVQIPILKSVLDAMGVRRYESPGFEADDIIGTASVICGAEGWECLIVTGDKDCFQLISDTASVRHVKSRMGQTETILYDRARFFEEYGFESDKIVDLKALMGDSSDNIPGVAGVGEKTALDLMRQFQSMDAVYDSLDDIKPAVRRKLEAGIDSARMSYELAKISTSADIAFSPNDNLFTAQYGSELFDLFVRLGFQRFIDSWNIKPGTSKLTASADDDDRLPELTISEGNSATFLRRFKDAESVSVVSGSDGDFEICDGNAVYRVSASDRAFLSEFFSASVSKTSHELKDLISALKREGIENDGFVFDTALAAYLIEPTEANYGLERLTPKYLEGSPAPSEAVFNLRGILDGKMTELGCRELYYDMELPLCRVLSDMEYRGFLVDRQALLNFGEALQLGVDILQSEIYTLAEEEFNINSPKQLGFILFDKLMLPHGKKTKTGWSTNADVLEGLIDKHPIIENIMEYRQLSKLKSTYADGLLKVISDDGRIHTNFKMTVTATGRLSSTEPNLQNIPVRTELGGEFRKMFIAPEGFLLVDADYSQIELRILAHVSGDDTMRNAFHAGEDIHAVTASQVFGVPLNEVTPLQRSRAKAVNFGIVYGISDFSLSRDIGVTRREAKEYIDNYLAKYHGVRDYMSQVVEKARTDGYVSTIFGRRRPMPELAAANRNTRAFGERVALNMPIQGSAADIIKLAMVNVQRRFESEGMRARLILQIHDELIVECPEEESEAAMSLLVAEMAGVVQLSVPLIADAHCGKSWYEAK